MRQLSLLILVRIVLFTTHNCTAMHLISAPLICNICLYTILQVHRIKERRLIHSNCPCTCVNRQAIQRLERY